MRGRRRKKQFKKQLKILKIDSFGARLQYGRQLRKNSQTEHSSPCLYKTNAFEAKRGYANLPIMATIAVLSSKIVQVSGHGDDEQGGHKWGQHRVECTL